MHAPQVKTSQPIISVVGREPQDQCSTSSFTNMNNKHVALALANPENEVNVKL